MNKAVNYLITLTVLIFTTQFYVLKSEKVLAQTVIDTDKNASKKFFGQQEKEMEKESQRLLESGNNLPDDNEIDLDGIEGDRPNDNDIGNDDNEIDREELNNSAELNRDELNRVEREELNREQLENRTETLEEHQPDKSRIRDVKAPDPGRSNFPYKPPVDEVEVEF